MKVSKRRRKIEKKRKKRNEINEDIYIYRERDRQTDRKRERGGRQADRERQCEISEKK